MLAGIVIGTAYFYRLRETIFDILRILSSFQSSTPFRSCQPVRFSHVLNFIFATLLNSFSTCEVPIKS